MPVDFPASPTNGQTYTSGAMSWTYDSTVPGWLVTPQLPGGVPAGTIVGWSTNTAPANWLICDGTAISRTTYASLFNVIGTTYGTGDGSTTFNLPDLRGRVPVGKNAATFGTLGGVGGTETHFHGSSALTAGAYVGYWATRSGTSWTATNSGGFTAPGGSTTAGTNGTAIFGNTDAGSSLQPYQVINYIIKTSMANTPGDSALATRIGALEIAATTTNKSGLVPIIPSSVTVGAGTASVDSTGKITFTNSRIISPNAVFSATYTNYLVQINITAASADNGLIVQFRNGTTVNTSATYRYTYTEWLDAAANPPSGGNLVNSIRIGRYATGGGMGELAFYSPYDSGNGTRVLGKTFDTAYYGQGGGWNQTAERHDSFCLNNHASITITGTMRIFGVVN